jgi:hypothetical protein
MLVMRTTKDPANPIGELVSSQEALRLDHLALAVHPFGLDGVQPRALLGQQATYDPHATAALFDTAVVRTEPAPHLFGDMPTGVVLDQKQDLFAESFEFLGTPSEKLRRYGTHEPTIHEPQPGITEFGQVESVAGDGLRLGVIFGDRLLDEAKWPAFLGEAAQGGQG